MINKEDKFKKELFELFKDDLNEIINDEDVMNILEKLFMQDEKEIDCDDLLDKLTSNE
ncbi:hypothetical protein L1S35_10625 [Flavobacterium sp. AS60]|uniref:hypothetical protein n=1 Tax=Flavobacterium anseongense TaxID=2910677 RepID=UPI001F30668D|nr:hypothetical protein [Flavobacterium sp. AS60]MCF6130131.1 hypothetical protein [Flavobacterium sp. AS60]